MKGWPCNVKWPQYHRYNPKAEHIRASPLLSKTHMTTGTASRWSWPIFHYYYFFFFHLIFLYGEQYVVVRTIYRVILITSLYLFIDLLNLFIPFYLQLGFPSDPNNSWSWFQSPVQLLQRNRTRCKLNRFLIIVRKNVYGKKRKIPSSCRSMSVLILSLHTNFN